MHQIFTCPFAFMDSQKHVLGTKDALAVLPIFELESKATFFRLLFFFSI